LYAALVKEEARLKELELEARKVAALEQQVKLQGMRLQLMAQQQAAGVGKGRVKAVVEASPTTGETQLAKLEVRAGLAGDPEAGGPGEKERRLLELVTSVSEILNRGGDLEERLFKARGILAEGVKEIGGSE
jgi:hypothetical protein